MLVQSERKRLVEMGQMMSVTQANVMLGYVTHVTQEAVALITDPVQKQAVLNLMVTELGKLINIGE